MLTSKCSLTINRWKTVCRSWLDAERSRGYSLLLKGERGSQTCGDLPLCEGISEQLSPLFLQLTYLLTRRDAPWRDRPGALCPCFHRDLGIIKGTNPLDLGIPFQPFILGAWWYFSSASMFHLTSGLPHSNKTPHTHMHAQKDQVTVKHVLSLLILPFPLRPFFASPSAVFMKLVGD